MEFIEESSPEEHWGSYDGVDHGFESRSNSPISRPHQTYPYEQLRGAGIDPAAPVAMDPLLPPAADWSAMFQPEVRGALQYVRAELQPGAMQALRATAWKPLGGNGNHGTVTPHLSTTGLAWADKAVAAGNAVLVDIAAAGSGQPVFDIVGQPTAVVALAAAGGPSAILTIPPALDKLSQQSAVQPVTPPVLPPAQQAGMDLPWKWIFVAGGGLVLVGGILSATKRSKR